MRRFGRKPYSGGEFIVVDKPRGLVLHETEYGPNTGVLFAADGPFATVFDNESDAIRAIERSQSWAKENGATSWERDDYQVMELFMHIRPAGTKRAKKSRQRTAQVVPPVIQQEVRP